MTKKTLFSAVFTGFYYLSFSQDKAIDTVYIQDQQLQKAEKTQTIFKLKAEDLQKNASNLSEVLRFQSPVYIKENGRGMVSSPSFRGTTAQQTAFIWNGLTINSLFLGQGDVNNISLLNAEELKIKPGGGSVLYGSGAIGGTIHLDNSLKFNQGFTGDVFVEYGSFKTLNSRLKGGFSNDKWSVSGSASYVTSENDYIVPEKKYVNLSGQYHNQSFLVNTAYKLTPASTLCWITESFFSTQNYPVFEISQTKTQYRSSTFRSLISWKYKRDKIENHLKTAYLEDDFSYFAKVGNAKSSGGLSKTLLAKNDFNYNLAQNLSVNLITEFQNQKGEGFLSGIKSPERNVYSGAALLRYQPWAKLYLEGGLKKDLIDAVHSPVLYSFGAAFQPVSGYEVKVNASKNFRNPSFNDLYWQPGGNPDLQSESSYQAEIANIFRYNDFLLTLTPYLINIKNLIQWIPTSAGYYSPKNTTSVLSKGVESSLLFTKKTAHSSIKLNATYAYTVSENRETKKQLMYVPLHKVNGSINYVYGSFGIYLQGLYNGLTYTSSDEDFSTAIKPYFVANSGIYINFKSYILTFKVNNLTDEVYEATAYYPMPKRNYSLNLNINLK